MEQPPKLHISRSPWKGAHFSGNMDSILMKTYDTNLRSTWISHLVAWPWKGYLTLKAHDMVLWREMVSYFWTVLYDLHCLQTQSSIITIRVHDHTTYMRIEFVIFGDHSFPLQTIRNLLKITHDFVTSGNIVFTSCHAWVSWPTYLINKLFLIPKHIIIFKWVI